MITCNKLSKTVTCLAFAENGSYFVTGGVNHLKFWHFDEQGFPILAQVQEPVEEGSNSEVSTDKQNFIMESKSADLTKIKVPNFVGVGCKDSNVYTLTQDGLLYVINESKKTEKWMNIKVAKALGM